MSTSDSNGPSKSTDLTIDWDSFDFDRIFVRDRAIDEPRTTVGRDKYKLLLEISKNLTATLALDDLLVEVLDTVLAVTRMQKGFLMLRDGDGRFRVEVARNIERKNLREEEFQLSRGVIREVARTGRPLYIADIEKRLRTPTKTAQEQRTIVSFPLSASPASRTDEALSVVHGQPDIERDRLGSRTIGLIYVESPLASAEFPVVDLEFIEALAGQAAVAIENARLYERLQRDRILLADENRDLRRAMSTRYGYQNMIGASASMRRVYDLLERVSASNINVMIRGESGTGKELVAKTIHYNSERASHPFVSINCAALPETLLESEVFGIEKGVATGVSKRVGKFEQADKGTFFLDEIGEMSLAIQAKLLRVLETRVFERVGGKVPIAVDVRILAATNRDLEAAIGDGSFREDLYFRLNVIPIRLPPLRERREDIPPLIEHFLEKHGAQGKIEAVSRKALDALVGYEWPGNVRELENVVQRSILMCDGNVLEIGDLPREMFERRSSILTTASDQGWTADRLVSEYAARALERNDGNLTKTARELGIDFKTLKKKLAQ